MELVDRLHRILYSDLPALAEVLLTALVILLCYRLVTMLMRALLH